MSPARPLRRCGGEPDLPSYSGVGSASTALSMLTALVPDSHDPAYYASILDHGIGMLRLPIAVWHASPLSRLRPAVRPSSMNIESARKWLRGGLIALAALQTFASAWQYIFPRSFYDDFPTVNLDPPYNEHLITDIGGLGLALAGILWFAAWALDNKVMISALIGYLIYAALHFLFHVRHFEHFSLPEALGVGTGLGAEVVLAVALLYLAGRVYQAQRTAK